MILSTSFVWTTTPREQFAILTRPPSVGGVRLCDHLSRSAISICAPLPLWPYHRRPPRAMVAPLYTTDSGLLFHAGKILVLTVGLPARGKTHISRALERYLRWTGVKIMVVSLGDYRRKILGNAGKLPSDYFTLGALDLLFGSLTGARTVP